MKLSLPKMFFNRHNTHFWRDKNPQLIRDPYFQKNCSLSVYRAIKLSTILWLYIYDANLNGEGYCNIQENIVKVAQCAIYQLKMQNMTGTSRMVHHLKIAGVLAYYSINYFMIGGLPIMGLYLWPTRSPELFPRDYYV